MTGTSWINSHAMQCVPVLIMPSVSRTGQSLVLDHRFCRRLTYYGKSSGTGVFSHRQPKVEYIKANQQATCFTEVPVSVMLAYMTLFSTTRMPRDM